MATICELDQLVVTDEELAEAGYRTSPYDDDGNYVGAPAVSCDGEVEVACRSVCLSPLSLWRERGSFPAHAVAVAAVAAGKRASPAHPSSMMLQHPTRTPSPRQETDDSKSEQRVGVLVFCFWSPIFSLRRAEHNVKERYPPHRSLQ